MTGRGSEVVDTVGCLLLLKQEVPKSRHIMGHYTQQGYNTAQLNPLRTQIQAPH